MKKILFVHFDQSTRLYVRALKLRRFEVTETDYDQASIPAQQIFSEKAPDVLIIVLDEPTEEDSDTLADLFGKLAEGLRKSTLIIYAPITDVYRQREFGIETSERVLFESLIVNPPLTFAELVEDRLEKLNAAS